MNDIINYISVNTERSLPYAVLTALRRRAFNNEPESALTASVLGSTISSKRSDR